MCLALLVEGLPDLPATMSFDSVAMSCLVTSPGSFLPGRGLTKRRRWLATFSHVSIRGRISRVGLLDRHLHPLNPFLDDLIDGLSALGLLHLAVAEGFGELQAVDPAAGVLGGEVAGDVDTKPAAALLAGGRVDELEREGRNASRSDADLKAPGHLRS
jgi:hypothetical protein